METQPTGRLERPLGSLPMKLAALLLAIASITWALPARCDNCPYSGFTCYTDSICGDGCSCIRINGPLNAGVCQ